jgi:hypothetical protein
VRFNWRQVCPRLRIILVVLISEIIALERPSKVPRDALFAWDSECLKARILSSTFVALAPWHLLKMPRIH